MRQIILLFSAVLAWMPVHVQYTTASLGGTLAITRMKRRLIIGNSTPPRCRRQPEDWCIIPPETAFVQRAGCGGRNALHPLRFLVGKLFIESYATQG